MTPYRAIISDLDGTLLNHEHQMSSFTIEILEKLAMRNVDIFFATGRSQPDVKQLVNKLNIKQATLVTSNGARATNLAGDLLISHSLPEDIAFDLLTKVPFDPLNACVNSYQGDDWFINVDVPALKAFHHVSGFTYQVVDFKTHHTQKTEKIFYISHTLDKLAPIEAFIREKYPDQVQLTYSTPQCLEVMPKDVCKAVTLSELARSRGYSLSECLAFGDGMNDLEMLSQAGKGCIMGNADPRLKQALPNTEVIGNNTDNAVAHTLHKVFNLA